MAIPGILNILMVVQRVPGLLSQANSRLRRSPFAAEIQELEGLLDTICKRDGLIRPQVVVKKYGAIGIHSDVALFHPGGKIVIDGGLLEFLSGRELQALLTHELSHLRYDTKRIFLYKLLSMLLLCPFDALLLLHDFAESEYEADDFAIGLMGDASPLRNALATLGAYNVTTSRSSVRNVQNAYDVFSRCPRVAKRLWDILMLFFDRSLFGATYPSLSERLQRLSVHDAGSPGY